MSTEEHDAMASHRGASERLSQLQAAILRVIAEGELLGEGGAYGWPEIVGKLRTRHASDYLSMSFPRAMRNLTTKGLIEPIPYRAQGKEAGQLWGLSARGRALVQARDLSPLGLADAHPVSIEIS